MKCSEAKLTIGIWKLPLVDLYGTHFKLKFYLVEGDGYLLVGKKIASKCQIRNDENLLIIPEGTEGISMEKIFISTYLSHDHRTHLLVVPAQSKCFTSYFASIRAFY